MYLTWPSTPQVPTRAAYTSVSAPQSTFPIIPVTTTTNAPATSGNDVVKPLLSNPSQTAGTGVITGAPATTSTTSGTAPDTTTTTTGANVPPPGTINYGAMVDPRFQQDPRNPLRVTYSYSATASVLTDGQFLPVAELPAGTLEFFSSASSGVVCDVPVGGTVVSGSCSITYPSFASYQVVANYVVGNSTYVSPILSDSVSPFTTTTVTSIHGGGSLGGLEFDANVTDQNGNAVTTGGVSMTISDTTQGWSYNVTVQNVGGDGANASAFSCVAIENYPSVGKYSGCIFNNNFVVIPASGDTLTETAVFAGTTDWTGSMSGEVSYTMP